MIGFEMPLFSRIWGGFAAALGAMRLISKWPLLCFVCERRLLASCNAILAALKCSMRPQSGLGVE